MKKKLLPFLMMILLVLSAATVSADADPPTNGGNGAGQSGQCTGAAEDRPASCQSP